MKTLIDATDHATLWALIAAGTALAIWLVLAYFLNRWSLQQDRSADRQITKRMRVLSAAEIDPGALGAAPEELRTLSWTGPRVIAAATPATREEMLRAIDLAIGGLDIGDLPKNWRPYDSQAPSAWNRAKPAPELEARYPTVRRALASVAARTHVPIDELRFLPLVGRQSSGSVILAPPGARVVDVLSVDGFL